MGIFPLMCTQRYTTLYMVCQGGITKYKALIAPCYTLTIQALRASHCISESSTLLKFANSLSATTLISLYTLPRDATYL